MYAKLFSRITESSLMEQPIETRYVFLALLAIADQHGDVIGTDVALARRINVPLDTFCLAVKHLTSPDPDSNSQAEEGRRIIPSDCGRGYRLVNYISYRDMRDENQRRDYMRNYMRNYMREKRTETVKHVKHVKLCLAQAEAEAEADVRVGEKTEPPQGFPKSEEEAKAQAEFAGVTPETAVKAYHKAVSRGYRDNKGLTIHNFRSHIKIEQKYADERNNKPNPRNAGLATDPTEQGKRIAEVIARRQRESENRNHTA